MSLVTVAPDGSWGYGIRLSAAQLDRSAIIPTGPGRVISSVVPDGITRVKWTFPDGNAGAEHAHPVAIWPDVHNNATVATVPPNTKPVLAAWRFTDGRVLTSTSETTALVTCRPRSGVLGGRNQIAPWLKQHFAMFRTPRPTRALLPESNSMDPPGYYANHGYRLNFAQARFVATGTGLFGVKGVWVVPGRSGLCVLDALQNGVCGPLTGYPQFHNGQCAPYCGSASPGSGGFWVSSQDDHGHNMYSGLVPDGNRTVTIILANGTADTVPVIDNVYSLTVNGRAVVLIDRDSTGHRNRFTLYANSNQF